MAASIHKHAWLEHVRKLSDRSRPLHSLQAVARFRLPTAGSRSVRQPGYALSCEVTLIDSTLRRGRWLGVIHEPLVETRTGANSSIRRIIISLCTTSFLLAPGVTGLRLGVLWARRAEVPLERRVLAE